MFNIFLILITVLYLLGYMTIQDIKDNILSVSMVGIMFLLYDINLKISRFVDFFDIDDIIKIKEDDERYDK